MEECLQKLRSRVGPASNPVLQRADGSVSECEGDPDTSRTQVVVQIVAQLYRSPTGGIEKEQNRQNLPGCQT